MKQTSLQSYKKLNKEKSVKKILKTLSRNRSGLTRNEISRYGGLTINNVCGRINELIQQERVCEVTGTRRDIFTNRRNEIINIKWGDTQCTS